MQFDYTSAARRISLPDAHLRKLCDLVRRDFPDDDMMFELHVLRALMAVESGKVTVAQILEEVDPALSPGS
ncbi:MAG: hypothetical protein HN341_00020 [Verrucomicrobia bacterium]|jgi:hypothetical protein|nr:hypothetical protein [Verrucomicrobiota bacterium]